MKVLFDSWIFSQFPAPGYVMVDHKMTRHHGKIGEMFRKPALSGEIL